MHRKKYLVLIGCSSYETRVQIQMVHAHGTLCGFKTAAKLLYMPAYIIKDDFDRNVYFCWLFYT